MSKIDAEFVFEYSPESWKSYDSSVEDKPIYDALTGELLP